MRSVVARRFRNEPSNTAAAGAQARNARVPFVVVMATVLPATLAAVNSRGELPRSKPMPAVRWPSMRKPSRSPASKTSGWRCRIPRASEISATGAIAVAPLPRAVTIVLVARSTSNTTHTLWLKSRWPRRANSAGAKRTSSVVGISRIKRFWSPLYNKDHPSPPPFSILRIPALASHPQAKARASFPQSFAQRLFALNLGKIGAIKLSLQFLLEESRLGQQLQFDQLSRAKLAALVFHHRQRLLTTFLAAPGR